MTTRNQPIFDNSAALTTNGSHNIRAAAAGSNEDVDPDAVYFAGVRPLVNPEETRTGTGNGPRIVDDSEYAHDFSDDIGLRGLDLSLTKRIGIGSGHILNDLCASLWFSYLLLYFENVVNLSSDYAAYLMLLGQIVDGISTPLIGYETDRYSHCIFFSRHYGRIKTWHLFGVILVTLSFPFIFTPCIGFDGSSDEDWAKLVYYAPFIAIFQIGWASTQISHLALIPKMNPDELVRTELLSIRYGFTVGANVIIFLLAWVTIGFKEGAIIDSSYAGNFQKVAYIAVTIGVACSILFHVYVKEHSDDFVKKCVAFRSNSDKIPTGFGSRLRRNSRQDEPNHNNYDPNVVASSRRINNIGRDDDTDESDDMDGLRPLLPPDTADIMDSSGVRERNGNDTGAYPVVSTRSENELDTRTYSLSTKCLSLGRDEMTVLDWLKLPQFYIVGLIYMMTRLSVNVTQVYVPLYLQKSLKLAATTVATVPLTMYIFGFLSAIFIKPINRLWGRQVSYILGALLAVGGSICILVLGWMGGAETSKSSYLIYVIAALLGSGASILLVTSLSITADLIGNNVDSGAFVYGAMSFTDKLACGGAVMLINSMVPCQKDDVIDCSAIAEDSLGNFYKRVLAYASGGCALVGVVGVVLVTLIIFLSRTRQTPQTTRH